MFKEHASLLIELTKSIAGIDLTDNQVDQFCQYGDLLLEWNQKMNLTSIIEPKEIIIKHFIDSMLLAKYIKGIKLADIGTGAGFPGIPLKIVIPDVELFLVDSLAKRLEFLKVVINDLKLQRSTTIHARAEEFGQHKDHREKYDIITSRAVARLPVLIEYAIPLLKINGLFLASKGPKVYEEIEESKNALTILKSEIIQTESFSLGTEAEKHIVVVIKKIEKTPLQYPRRPGLPAKKPLA